MTPTTPSSRPAARIRILRRLGDTVRYRRFDDGAREVPKMVDILLRGVPEDVVRGLDRRAEQLGISRAELLRRELAVASRVRPATTTVADLARCAATFADLADDDVMAAAWS